MGALANALRKKFKSPREALEALGLDPALLEVKRLATDSRRRAHDDDLADVAREHPGAEREWDMGPKADGDPDLGDERDDEDDDEESDPDERAAWEAKLRKIRRMQMRDTVKDCLRRGMSHDEIHERLLDWPRPATEEGGMGGQLGTDAENTFAEDVSTVMTELGKLTGMGGTMPLYEEENMKQSKDSRRKQAHDRKLAQDSFRKFYPEAGRLDGDMVSTRYGDQEPPALARNEAACDGAAEADRWFGLSRVGIA